MSHSDTLREALINRKEKICSKSEILEIIEEYKSRFKHRISAENMLKYLSRHNYLKKIFHSYYYINSVDEQKRHYCYLEDKELLFSVLNALKTNWYVGLNSAKYLSSANWQVPRVLHIVNTKFSGRRRILSLKVSFSKIKPDLFFGLKQSVTKNKIPFKYSTAKKTAQDIIYLRDPKWFGKK